MSRVCPHYFADYDFVNASYLQVLFRDQCPWYKANKLLMGRLALVPILPAITYTTCMCEVRLTLADTVLSTGSPPTIYPLQQTKQPRPLILRNAECKVICISQRVPRLAALEVDHGIAHMLFVAYVTDPDARQDTAHRII